MSVDSDLLFQSAFTSQCPGVCNPCFGSVHAQATGSTFRLLFCKQRVWLGSAIRYLKDGELEL